MDLKKSFRFFVLLLLLVFLYSCSHSGEQQENVFINSDKSFFYDFEIHENYVIFRCHYSIINKNESTALINLRGNFSNDVKLGLIKEEFLFAQEDLDNANTIISVLPGENEIDVIFVGTFAGTEQKENRLLPKSDILIVTDG